MFMMAGRGGRILDLDFKYVVAAACFLIALPCRKGNESAAV
jgi:hypothetical protein